MSNLVQRAKEFAIAAHGDQMYAKYKYAYHLQCVVDLVEKRNKDAENLEILLAVAWLHDVVEDTAVTHTEIKATFGEEVGFPVWLLTKKKFVEYEAYMIMCKSNDISLEVKKCDTMTNLHHSFKGNRSKGVLKYSKQLAILEE